MFFGADFSSGPGFFAPVLRCCTETAPTASSEPWGKAKFPGFCVALPAEESPSHTQATVGARGSLLKERVCSQQLSWTDVLLESCRKKLVLNREEKIQELFPEQCELQLCAAWRSVSTVLHP